MRLALVDVTPDIDFLQDALIQAGHHCYLFEMSAVFWTVLRNDTFDLIVFNAPPAGPPGLDALVRLRTSLNLSTPSVLLADSGTDQDIVAALDAGADDYITKPIGRAVLIARLNALMRRIGPRDAEATPEIHGPFTLHPARNMIVVDGEAIMLTVKEFELAATLFRNMGKPLSRGYLREVVWGRNPELPSRTLDVHISRIRTKVGLRPARGFRLVHVYGFGYRLEQIGVGGEGEGRKST
jgi:DNA-binding response OmpR family regulator